jgi:hypothetical protein
VRTLLVIYLCLYYLLIAATIVTLWRSGLSDRLPREGIYGAIALAITLGGILALTSRRPPDQR